jgi:hypothetical protein
VIWEVAVSRIRVAGIADILLRESGKIDVDAKRGFDYLGDETVFRRRDRGFGFMDTEYRSSKFWPDFAWRWKICDTCRHSRFWKRALFCDTCGTKLRVSDLPLERIHWLSSWLNLALWLWLLQFLLFGTGAEAEQVGFSFLTMIGVAALLMAGVAFVLIWRLTPAIQQPPKSEEPK